MKKKDLQRRHQIVDDGVGVELVVIVVGGSVVAVAESDERFPTFPPEPVDGRARHGVVVVAGSSTLQRFAEWKHFGQSLKLVAVAG